MRILHVIGYLGRGGDTSVVLNVMEHMDKSKYKFDFLTHQGADKNTIKELKDKDCNVYVLDGDVRKSGPIKYYLDLMRVLKCAPVKYDAIHVHTSMQSGVSLLVARQVGIPIRICHSHVSEIQRKSSKLSRMVSIPVFKFLFNTYSTKKLACSQVAGEFLFGKKQKFQVLYNAIDIEKYIKVSNEDVAKERDKLGCSASDILIGHVANFTYMKNQEFVVQLANKLQEFDNIKFVLVGSGSEFEKIKEKACYLSEKVILTGQRSDVNILMKCFDGVILPSRRGEGFPVTMIEAQAAGCNCIISNNVTNEVEVGLGLVESIPLESIEKWIESIKCISRKVDIKERNKYATLLREKGFSVDNFVKCWIKLYEQE